ncbi:FadR/GntR family transcriptional regulator [Macrococcus sp. DPC7161]|uniref:FadR/GntR family transcriptional regulator n=1 Tax=Macrococcus sp. DPC7161 TaxID=2507060 RepID=UPI00100ACC13|nr:GntR family transcriptional regulator [Macrococcus sp. DPC7161]RXK18230.1 FadR family transcriptional regulator [Macrococcus sp. DPC7161]
MSQLSDKGFTAVVTEIQQIIKDQGLSSGDKLPSERYLSESLKISRSSVREALRAMELLGVIYTKRGEGTFLSEMSEHQLFELIAGYLITSSSQQEQIKQCIAAFEQYAAVEGTFHEENEVFQNNSIMSRIWKLLKQYENINQG